ncbi:hypothetical protein [Aliikangiella sp. G2MR2-5]|uniref:hypothetical protein n=1 Tax=Aliikangiella sp. G2MR2-5 TaxID=2788943 RepID=UPI0018AA166C|nr:hypothetical protein [Aliikangiella sp. G2MR2-5]
MVITKKRIKTLTAYTKRFRQGEPLVVSVRSELVNHQMAVDIGFSEQLTPGESVLPEALGKVSQFNAQGREILLKDQPKETHYRQQEWVWKEYRGQYDYVEKSKILNVPYERYPRKTIPPPAVELCIASNGQGEKLIVADSIVFLPENEALLIHVINLFLEIFGQCEILIATSESVIRAPLKKLNWEVLAAGKKLWNELEPIVDKIVKKISVGNRKVINKRLMSINLFGPEFIAIGRAGFTGDWFFGFPEKRLFLLESMQINSATYVIENDWGVLSGLSRAELFESGLHRERIEHRDSWFNEVDEVLGA